MEKRGWRVRMCRFKGAPSEVLILKPPQALHGGVGLDITMPLGVRKYYKPVPVNLEGKVIGDFPSFIPKTDEPNYQRVQKQIDMLIGHPYYITEKCDGSSTTAYKQDGELYVASRNWMLAYDENNGYWKVAEKYNLRELLPEGVALQWETCGPKIQRNNHKLKEVDGYAFSAYYITHKRYLDYDEFIKLCDHLKFPRARRIQEGSSFDGNMNQMRILSEDQYENGHIREGIVIRSQSNLLGHQPISFKVINLEYET
jgi:RNA ligase (TIGR02306 family)